MKNNKGITLIALIVTIIVLIILAGVAIAMLSGDNSILKNAQDAGISTALNSAKEELGLAASEGLTNYYKAIYVSGNNGDTIKQYVEAKVKNPASANDTGFATNYFNGITYTYTTGTDTANLKLEYKGNHDYYYNGVLTFSTGGIKWTPSDALKTLMGQS